MGRIGIFGGSFDPVHNGHVVMAVEALEQARLDRLLVVPAALSPHKADREPLAGALRVELLELAYAGLRGVEILDLELRRGGLSYTVDTVHEIGARFPDDDLLLLVGADSLRSLHTWRDAESLVRKCAFLVAVRPGFPLPKFPGDAVQLPGFRMEALRSTPMGVSSSQVRERATAGRPLRGFVPDAVARRIAEDQLFQKAPPA